MYICFYGHMFQHGYGPDRPRQGEKFSLIPLNSKTQTLKPQP